MYLILFVGSLISVALITSKAAWRFCIDNVVLPLMKILISFASSKELLLFLPKKPSGRMEKDIFPGRDVECARIRNQKHRGRKTSRSHLINLQRISEVILSAFVLFPSLQTPFRAWWLTKEKGVLFQGLLSLGEKHFQFTQLVPLSLFIRKRFYFFPSQGSTSLGIKQWAWRLVPWHLVLFFSLCIKVRGTFLGVELSVFFCVLQYLLYPLEDTHMSSLLGLDSLLFQWLGIIKSRNQTIGSSSLEANLICSFSQIHVL